MSREQFVEAAKSSPLPNVRDHKHVYNCHMATLNWALRSQGVTETEAVLKVDEIAARHCPGCIGTANQRGRIHDTLKNEPYAKNFCMDMQGIERGKDLDQQFQPGDVIVVGGRSLLTHSMVAIKVESAEAHIRGFNNATTFVDAIDLRGVYDDNDRRLSDATAWNQRPDIFWFVDYEDYIRRLNHLLEVGPEIESAVHSWYDP